MIDVLLWTLYFWLVCAASLCAVLATLTVWAVLGLFRMAQRRLAGRPAHRRR
ncbi:hypothetical protein [Arthrobacter phage SWEP2]|uniref:Uncharacterized protein n=1 Tax=Arthrobacter phage SWEP2 TaxID=2945958 RepID=A0A9E7MJ33_9CAUD|nr:hypothetical protein [Arthrobacter phage SWEP2]